LPPSAPSCRPGTNGCTRSSGTAIGFRSASKTAAILTRRGHDWTDRFPAIRHAAKALPVRLAVIDGAAVVEVNGIASFSALQAARGAREGPGHRAAHEAVFYAFDLPHLNGVDLRPAPLLKRKAALVELVGNGSGAIRYSEHLTEDGDAMFRQACAMALEGVIPKRPDRPYRAGRGEDWVKVKCIQSQEFVSPATCRVPTARKASARSCLATMTAAGSPTRVVFGTGFSSEVARSLWNELQPLRRKESAFPERLTSLARKGVV
jgi:bifunctional non-homologous end joining protein LigD